MKRLSTIDAETDPFVYGRAPRPFIWGYFDGGRFMKFADALNLAEYLRTKKETVYAHNGGKFDFYWLLEHATPYQEIKIINGRLVQFKMGKATCRDSWPIYPQALATHDKGEIDYAKFEEDVRDEFLPEIIEYLERDVRSLHTITTTFVEGYGAKLTLPGAAMSFWSKLSGIEKPRTSYEYFKQTSPFYFGGRVEAFQSGVFNFKPGTFQSYDVVSAFPAAMCEPQPWKGEGPVLLLDGLGPKAQMGECLYHFKARSWGAFPLRGKDNSISFPHDGQVREFHCTGWELRAALEARDDWDLEVIQRRHYTSTITFSDYVEHFGQIKKHAPKRSAEREIAKLFLNSLYGKFAANPEKYRRYMIVPIADPDPEGWVECDRAWPWKFVQKPLEDHEQWYYDLGTGAGITGYQRAKLYTELVAQFGPDFWASKRCFYCDTDNIKGLGVKPSRVGLDFGDWELETCKGCGKARTTDFAIAGKKLYSEVCECGQEKNRSKGVKLTRPEIFRVAQGETVTYRSPAPSISVRAGLRFTKRDVRKTV